MIHKLTETFPNQEKDIEINVKIKIEYGKYGNYCSTQCSFWQSGRCHLADEYENGIELVKGSSGYNRTAICTSLEEESKYAR